MVKIKDNIFSEPTSLRFNNLDPVRVIINILRELK